MNRSIKSSLVLALLVLGNGTIQPATFAQKTKTFWTKYKAPIIAAVAVLAAAGVAFVAYKQGNRTLAALEAAGIRSSDDNYTETVAIVTLLGGMG